MTVEDHNKAIEEAHRKVAALPASHREALEREFLRAEREAAEILKYQGPTQ